jgi:hypothetical protein
VVEPQADWNEDSDLTELESDLEVEGALVGEPSRSTDESSQLKLGTGPNSIFASTFIITESDPSSRLLESDDMELDAEPRRILFPLAASPRNALESGAKIVSPIGKLPNRTRTGTALASRPRIRCVKKAVAAEQLAKSDSDNKATHWESAGELRKSVMAEKSRLLDLKLDGVDLTSAEIDGPDAASASRLPKLPIASRFKVPFLAVARLPLQSNSDANILNIGALPNSVGITPSSRPRRFKKARQTSGQDSDSALTDLESDDESVVDLPEPEATEVGRIPKRPSMGKVCALPPVSIPIIS